MNHATDTAVHSLAAAPALLLALLAAAPAAQAGKIVDRIVAVNEVQQLAVSASGGSFHVDVPYSTAFLPLPQPDEHQSIKLVATGGTFTIRQSGEESAPLPHGASAAEVQAALEALAAFGPGNVDVTSPEPTGTSSSSANWPPPMCRRPA